MMNKKFLRSPIVFLVGLLYSVALVGGTFFLFLNELLFLDIIPDFISLLLFYSSILLPGLGFGLLVFILGVLNGVGRRGWWWVVASLVSWSLVLLVLAMETLMGALLFGFCGLVGGLVLLIAGRFIHKKSPLWVEISALVIAFILPMLVYEFLSSGPEDQQLFFVMILWQASALVMIDLLMRYSSRQA